MDATRTPLVVLLAGPNGAGKSTSAEQLLVARSRWTSSSTTVDRWQAYDNAEVSGPRMIASRLPRVAPHIVDPSRWNGLKALP